MSAACLPRTSDVPVSDHRQRRADRARGRGPHAARAVPARGRRAHRHQHRLRHHVVRRVHRAARRRVGEVVHGARRAGRRRARSPPSKGSPTATTLHPMQEAFREHHGLQCGYCTPGMVMAAVVARRRRTPTLTEAEVREGLEGNLCRCTGYHNIVAGGARGLGGARRGVAASDPRRVRLRPGRLGRRSGRAARRARRRRQAARRRPLAAAADEAAAGHARRCSSTSAGSTTCRTSRDDGDEHRHRRAHPPPRRRARRDLLRAHVPLLAHAAARRSAIRRCATAARSAARSPTATRRPTCPRSCSRSAARSSRAGRGGERRDRGRRLLHGLPRDRARARRDASPRSGCRRPAARAGRSRSSTGARRTGPSSASPRSATAPRRRAGQHGLHAAAGRRRSRPRCDAARRPPTPPRSPARAPTRPSDLNASPEYRRHLARVLVGRALDTVATAQEAPDDHHLRRRLARRRRPCAGSKTRRCCGARAPTSTTSTSPACCTSRSCARRSRTREIRVASTRAHARAMPGVVARVHRRRPRRSPTTPG